jgi:DNA polymerase-1
LGIAFNGFGGDTLLMGYLLNPGRNAQELAALSAQFLDAALPDGQAEADAIQAQAQAVQAVFKLHSRLFEELRQNGLDALYTDLELPLLDVLWRMECNGIAVDTAYLQRLDDQMRKQLEALEVEVLDIAGERFNLNSPKQLAHVLFEVLGLPVVKKTKTGPSTDSEVLLKLMALHPLPGRLLEYRELAKLTSTYVEALPRLVSAEGRIHTSFNQTVAATGRLSSSDPNLQNIPVKTELGRSIRKAFIPGKGQEVFRRIRIL